MGEAVQPRLSARGTTRRPSPSVVILGVAAVASVAIGSALAAGWSPPTEQLVGRDLNRSLTVMGGALLFGAGLLHLSMWRLGENAARAYAGAALAVLGLILTLTWGSGHLLHEGGVAAALNPVTMAWAALASLGLMLAALTSGLRGQVPQVVRPSVIAAGLVTVTLLGLGVVAELRSRVDVTVELSAASHVRIELFVALAWAAAAVFAHVRRAELGVPSLPAAVLGALSLLWVLRAAAVHDVEAWGLSSAVLLAVIAVVVLTAASSDFVDATEAEHIRADEAERAVVSAAYELQQHDTDTRALNHDVRNMLLALRTASQTLADHGDRLGAEARHELEHAICAEAVKLDELISTRAREARERGHAAYAAPQAVTFVPAQRRTMMLEGAR